MTKPASHRPSFSPARRWRIALDLALRTVLVLAVVAMLNWLGAKRFHRFYLSDQTQVELSSRTLNILRSITNEVTVTLYYDTQDPENFYSSIRALLDEYQVANKRISIRTVNYLRDPGAAAKVKEEFDLPGAATSPNAPPSKDLVIFSTGDRHLVVPGEAIVQHRLEQTAPDDPKQKELQFRKKPVAFNGEIMFTTKLLALSRAQLVKACFLQGHGESAVDDTSVSGYAKFTSALIQNGMSVNLLELAGDAPVPSDCGLLIIAGPVRAFSEPELQKIDQYLAEGGRLLVLFNYASIQRPTGLEPLLQRWGVRVGSTYVKDPDSSLTDQVLLVRQFNSKSFVNPLEQLALEMVLPRPVEKITADKPPAGAPVAEELAWTTPASVLAGESAAPRSYPLIAAVEQKPVAGVAGPRGGTRIVVAGDSLFLDNQLIDAAANRDFLNYALNWLVDREELVAGINPRPVTEFRLLLTKQQQQQLRWLLLGALPGGVLFLGWLVWLVRRK